MGDFNYQYKDWRTDGSLISAPVAWTDFLDDYYIDVFGDDKHNTWHSGRNAGILDYIFCSSNAHHLVTSTSQEYLSPEWTDHELLGFSFQFQDTNARGPGVWKANPYLARNKDFRKALSEFLIGTKQHDEAAQTSWIGFPGAGSVNQQIQSLQHSIAEIEILKAGKYYREHGEKSPGFLKRSVVSRENRRSILELRDPTTGLLCQDEPEISTIATDFYSSLFTPEALDPTALSIMIRSIPQHLKLFSDQQESLMLPIDVDELLVDSKKTRRLSSPGPDGLPYEILYLIKKFPPYRDLINVVYNAALAKGKFPASWNELVMCLLYKKGDPADMKNYRPLSLANSDYKLFIRNANRRIMDVSFNLISRHQLGFIPGRFIAENGMICQLIMEDAQRKWTIAEQKDDDSTFSTWMLT